MADLSTEEERLLGSLVLEKYGRGLGAVETWPDVFWIAVFWNSEERSCCSLHVILSWRFILFAGPWVASNGGVT